MHVILSLLLMPCAHMLVKWLWSPSEVLWFVIFTKWATPPMWSPCVFFLWFWILQDITTFHKRSQSISCCPHTKSIVFFLVESLCFVAVEKFHIVGNPFLRCFAFLNIGVEFYKTSLDITTFSPSSKFWWNARKMLRNAKIHKKNCNVGNVLHNVAQCCGMLYNEYIVWKWFTNWIVISC